MTENVAAAEEVGTNFVEGGGIDNGGTLKLILSTVSENLVGTANGEAQNGVGGAGISNTGTLLVDRSTISGNEVAAKAVGAGETNGYGGGIANSGMLTVSRSTIAGNEVSASGGAMFNTARGGGLFTGNDPALTITVDRSTISGNTISSSTPDFARGGGLAISGGTFSLSASTVTGNSAPGAANIDAGVPAASFANTIVADPEGGGENCGIALPSAGYNLDDGESCGFDQPSDQANADPLLGLLTDNGGPTPTHALLPGSPAIDRGLFGGGVTTDQRGLPRPSDFPAIANPAGGDGADVGAYELQGGIVPGAEPPGGAPQPPAPPLDTVSPKLRINRSPGKRTFDRTPTFRFSSEPGARFRCKLDRGRVKPCRSPRTTRKLRFGRHVFRVRAIDAAGNRSAAKLRRFEVLKPIR